MKIWHLPIVVLLVAAVYSIFSLVMIDLDSYQSFTDLNTSQFTPYTSYQGEINNLTSTLDADTKQPVDDVSGDDLTGFWSRIGSTYQKMKASFSVMTGMITQTEQDLSFSGSDIVFTLLASLLTIFLAWKIIEFIRKD